MATVEKFMFDLDFGDAHEADEPEAIADEAEELIEEEVIPTFSEEELAAAEKKAFAAGKEEGRRDAAAATEQRLVETVDQTSEELMKIINAQADANKEIAREMVSVATTIAKKMFPDLNARNALGEVERVVQDTLSAINDEPRVQIFVHPDLRDPFTERLNAMTSRSGFEGKVMINPDPAFNMGDCRVEWSNGSAIRDTDWLMEKIDEIIERNLHGDVEEEAATPETEAEAMPSADDDSENAADAETSQQSAHTQPPEAASSERPDASESMEANNADDAATDHAAATTADETEGSATAHDASRPNPDEDTFAPHAGTDIDPAEAEIMQKIQSPTATAEPAAAPVTGTDTEHDINGTGASDDGKPTPAEAAPAASTPQAMSQETTAAILDAQGMDDDDKA